VAKAVSLAHVLRRPFARGFFVGGLMAAAASSLVGLPLASRKRPIFVVLHAMRQRTFRPAFRTQLLRACRVMGG
jgi:hypothetical protein